MFFDFEFALESLPEILAGVPTTLMITVVSIAFGLIIGFAAAICRMYKIPVLNRLAIIYVSVIRGTPMLVQMYIIYYSLPEVFDWFSAKMGWDITSAGLPSLAFAYTSFTIYSGAYLSEMIRSALGAVDHGQMEAAQSIGLTPWQSYRRIIIPQALVVALPSLSNTFLATLKGTSLAFTVMVVDILAKAKIQAAAGYRYMEAYVDAAIIYWVLCIVFEKLFAWMEKKAGHFKTASA